MGLWILRALLTLLIALKGWIQNPHLLLGGLAFWSYTAAPVLLLLVCRGRGAYLPEMAKKRGPGKRWKSSEPRKTCRRCGGPCPDIDNNWTREELCSKKCMEKGE
jgi:hypothetical protein